MQNCSSFDSSSNLIGTFLSKEFIFRNITAAIKGMTRPSRTHQEIINVEAISKESEGFVLSPCYIKTILHCKKEQSKPLSIKDIDSTVVDINFDSLEVNLSLSQVEQIKETLQFIELERRKILLVSIRKTLFKSIEATDQQKFNPKLMWNFALQSVLFLVRQRSRRSNNKQLLSALDGLILRRKYKSLYKRKIITQDFHDAQSNSDDNRELSENEEQEILYLESVLCVNDLVAYQHQIHQEMLKKGFGKAVLLKFIKGDDRLSWWQKWSTTLTFSQSNGKKKSYHT